MVVVKFNDQDWYFRGTENHDDVERSQDGVNWESLDYNFPNPFELYTKILTNPDNKPLYSIVVF